MTTSQATQMAGIIAATTNGVGILGVAPDAEIIPVKIFTDAGSLEFAAFITGLDYAAADGADVINMSFNAVLAKAGVCLPDGCLTEEQIDALATITRRAIRYARRRRNPDRRRRQQRPREEAGDEEEVLLMVRELRGARLGLIEPCCDVAVAEAVAVRAGSCADVAAPRAIKRELEFLVTA